MKFLLIFSILIPHLSFAQIKPILKCLGSEEAMYHKEKKGGAFLNLNRRMISEFIQMSSTLELKTKYRDEICHHKIFPPSVSLLYTVLKDQEKAFIIKADNEDVVEISKDEKTLQEVIQKSFDTFLNFIDDLQMHASEPDCILNKIPDLKELYLKTRYILEDTGQKVILSEITNLEEIMNKLVSKDLLKNCPKKRP